MDQQTYTDETAKLLSDILVMLEACGYGGSNRTTENSHKRRIKKLLAEIS